MRIKRYGILVLTTMTLTATSLSAQVSRFPKPDFQSGYIRPELQTPAARSLFMEYLDVVVLIAALSLASYFALKKRSRRYVFVLMVFSLIYFGFYREGCICPIGSIQNMTYALFNSGYAIPFSVVAFFVLPLVFTLFFGRTFCAAVCPLGAMQDAVVLKPMDVPKWASEVLSLLPYLYLGLAVLFAATGAGYIICRYDPFIGFFRFGASFNMVVFGVSMLLLGTVIGRPYCRFLCPYGLLLNWMSRLSRRHLTITPNECINCRLCEASCPFGAIKKPTLAAPGADQKASVRNLALFLVLVPAIIFANGWAVSALHIPLSRQHFTVALAQDIRIEDAGQRAETTVETRTFRASGVPTSELFKEAATIQGKFKTGTWILGGFLGLIFCLKSISLTRRRKQIEFDADNGTCFSCARCVPYCPIEQVRLGLITPEEAERMRPVPQ
jgi:polyferredoxin